MPEILRYAAFTRDPSAGNPAGVVLDATGLDDREMLAIAADLGYSETAFLTDTGDAVRARYFSPQAEVSFCGHATIAAAVARAEVHGPGDLALDTAVGRVDVAVEVREGDAGPSVVATLTSVAPAVTPLPEEDLEEILAALRWSADELDERLPPRLAYAGAYHPVIAAATPERLAALDYDFERLGALMAARDHTTVALVHDRGGGVFEARNPFPPGGVVEDPATGAAAAAFGAYLRHQRLVTAPTSITIHQGGHIGRPSRLEVEIPAGPESGIRVTGAAVAIPPTG
jgi:PhzF family phenazine biosynthesis protein